MLSLRSAPLFGHAAHNRFTTQAVAASCGISAMPTFQVWKNGAKAKEFVGASKDKLKALCEEAPGL